MNRMHRSPDRRTPANTAGGVIDTIADGLTFVIQRPYLLIVPLVLDLLLWLVFRVPMDPIIDQMIRFLQRTNVEGSNLAIENLQAAQGQVMISDALSAFVPSLFSGMSIDTIMGMFMTMMVPEGFGVPRADIYAPWQNGLVTIDGLKGSGQVMLVGIASVIASSLAMTIFRVPMARAIRSTNRSTLGEDIRHGWIRTLAYFGIVIGLAVLAFIPFTLLSLLGAITGLGLTFVLSFAILILGSMAGIYSFFVMDAVYLHRVSPVEGFRLCYAVVRPFFGQTFRFVFTYVLVMLATMRLWITLSGSGPGFLIAMLGSAFIGSVLSASSMLFYADRFRLVRAAAKSGRAGSRRT